MNKKALTLTIVTNMTSNYGEGLGNISSVQKLFKDGKTFTSRSKESLKHAIMTQSGFYDDLKVEIDKAAQKEASEDLNASNCRALEGGYLNTINLTYKRESSFHVTDAISCEPFVNETRFHNNLHLATAYAKQNNLNLQQSSDQCGLMPYQYEYEKAKKVYSITIDLEAIGKDDNFKDENDNIVECGDVEKTNRVIAIINAIKNLSLLVKGNLDNAEPIFIVGGLSDRKTHFFENCIRVKQNKLVISNDIKNKLNNYSCALMKADNFDNEEEIIAKLNPKSIDDFFNNLEKNICNYYGVNYEHIKSQV